MLRVGHVGLQVAGSRARASRIAERDPRAARVRARPRRRLPHLQRAPPRALAARGRRAGAGPHRLRGRPRDVSQRSSPRVDVIERGSVGVADAFRFLAPGGLVIEVVHGMAHDQPRHYDSVAPRPLKFEHVTVKSTRKDELEAVLIDVLGLRLSDRAEDAVSWLRASDEHHGVSVIGADVDALHHYAWQLRRLRHVRPHRRPPAPARPDVPLGPGPPRHRRQLLLLLPRRRRRRGRVLGRHPAHRGRGGVRAARLARRAADRQPLGQPGAAGGVRRRLHAGGRSPAIRPDRPGAIVTGAGRGLGRAIALAFAAEGVEVTAVEPHRGRPRVARRLPRAAVRRDRSRALLALPETDILVVSAGTNVPEPFLEVDA